MILHDPSTGFVLPVECVEEVIFNACKIAIVKKKRQTRQMKNCEISARYDMDDDEEKGIRILNRDLHFIRYKVVAIRHQYKSICDVALDR